MILFALEEKKKKAPNYSNNLGSVFYKSTHETESRQTVETGLIFKHGAWFQGSKCDLNNT